MSQLEQYPINVLAAVSDDIVPGALVKHVDWPQSLGTVVALGHEINNDWTQVLVLWTRGPGVFALPNVRRVFPSLIANQITQIQPMTLPVGNIFLMDYTFRSGSV